MTATADPQVTLNEAKSRYELEKDGLVAFAAFERRGDVYDFNHTVVPRELEGQGIGSKLVAAALADVKAKGGEIEATCSFVHHYLRKHPEAA